jgi:hypothetical protein
MDTQTSKREALREIYDHAVKLVEALHIIIPKMDTFEKVPPLLEMRDLADKCFELGGDIYANYKIMGGTDNG